MIRTSLLLVLTICASVALVSFTANTGAYLHSQTDTIPAARKKITDELLQGLGSRSSAPAETVYKNIKVFTGADKISAKQLLDTMQYWSSSLDINCDYCHTKEDYASETPSAKQIARDMFQMQATINKDLLKKIKNLATESVIINCYTCHNGSVLPMN